MSDLLIRAAMAAVAIGFSLYHHATLIISADGYRMMPPLEALRRKGVVPPSPFHLRWLLPFVLRRRVWAWCAVAWASLLATVVLFPGDLWAAALWCCMPWFRTMAVAPVLVDAPALAGALASRRWPSFWWGSLAPISERAPVWAALFSWNAGPVFLGLALTLIAMRRRHAPTEHDTFALGLKRGGRWNDGKEMLLTWGAGMAALLSTGWTAQDVLIVAVAYGQMLVAGDTVRMIQWSAPVVLPRAVAVIPAPWRLPALVATWLNPWARAPRGQVLC